MKACRVIREGFSPRARRCGVCKSPFTTNSGPSVLLRSFVGTTADMKATSQILDEYNEVARAAVAMAGQRKASFSAAALSARLQAPRCGSAAGGESGGGRSLALVFQTS